MSIHFWTEPVHVGIARHSSFLHRPRVEDPHSHTLQVLVGGHRPRRLPHGPTLMIKPQCSRMRRLQLAAGLPQVYHPLSRDSVPPTQELVAEQTAVPLLPAINICATGLRSGFVALEQWPREFSTARDLVSVRRRRSTGFITIIVAAINGDTYHEHGEYSAIHDPRYVIRAQPQRQEHKHVDDDPTRAHQNYHKVQCVRAVNDR